MSQKVLGGGLLVGVGYVLYQLFNSDENKEVKPELELKDVKKNIFKGKNDFDIQMKKVDLDNQTNEEETTNVDEVTNVEEALNIEEATILEEATNVEEAVPEEEATNLEEINPEEEVASTSEETIEDIPSDDSNTIERIVRI
jgi:copper chaperone CopZ